MIAKGSMREEWCYVASEGGRALGRLAYWTMPGEAHPLSLVLLDLPWVEDGCAEIGRRLLQESLPAMRALGAREIEHVLDVPVMAPQWQTHPEARMRFLEEAGFAQIRQTCRFERIPGKSATVDKGDAGLSFRSLAEVGETAFIAAIEQANRGTLDLREQGDRDRLGPVEHARRAFEDLRRMAYEPDWWQLAYTPSGELVGLIMPAKSPTFATIGFIGVVPEHRGRGYIHALLRRGTAILEAAGVAPIRADTDVNNHPMANAFAQAGYAAFANRREYRIELDSRTESSAAAIGV
ncbi:GNAT family N-acetyltransferase [Cohnella nanjingensis]|nr:GNAT family N-acetyltransferase [Cohnella nanjingensis]